MFYEKVMSSEDMSWLGVNAREEIAVQDNGSGTIQLFTVDTILEHSWKELSDVIRGIASPSVMMHLSRIVGYWSRVKNWNKSKLAELRDRQKGDYAVGGDMDKIDAALPQEVVDSLATSGAEMSCQLVA